MPDPVVAFGLCGEFDQRSSRNLKYRFFFFFFLPEDALMRRRNASAIKTLIVRSSYCMQLTLFSFRSCDSGDFSAGKVLLLPSALIARDVLKTPLYMYSACDIYPSFYHDHIQSLSVTNPQLSW